MAHRLRPSVQFFPVVHLLTGPPGLARNGGIWKSLKTGLSGVSDQPRLLVQAIHFAQYTLSPRAWEGWFGKDGRADRIASEMKETFGVDRDVFLDSGGFQLLHSDKIDLSKWNLKLTPEDIFNLQMKFRPNRYASLDVPIAAQATNADAARAMSMSIDNSAWLADRVDAPSERTGTPYLVLHGRSPAEIRLYGKNLEEKLPRGWLQRGGFGIALGSQVPLTQNPGLVCDNVREAMHWVGTQTPSGTPLHVFGVGDSIVGGVMRSLSPSHPLSYDNSTYVQKAFHLRFFDPRELAYREFDPALAQGCGCSACGRLRSWGPTLVTNVLSAPAYVPGWDKGVKVSRSDVMGSIALHNLHWWRTRVQNAGATPPGGVPSAAPPSAEMRVSREYEFPLANFHRRGESLVLLTCSRTKPYSTSRSQRRVRSHLRNHGFKEEREYDRITLSGLFGPVHWDDERKQPILSYDFRMDPTIGERHRQRIRVRTGLVLSSVAKKYDRVVAVLRPGAYEKLFRPVLETHDADVVSEAHQVCEILGKN